MDEVRFECRLNNVVGHEACFAELIFRRIVVLIAVGQMERADFDAFIKEAAIGQSLENGRAETALRSFFNCDERFMVTRELCQ